ncbi:uncharacterized protein DFL_001779 [Arthrobotrys flagrans]|uniref:Uncharacterized protein n=1 Tax=Arthrobotrys flagrans TaxID=97331 RepID=A0A437A8S9_ARTFL|nr:hypothetical protein DFL_001779 [Arthrobotrys flagrans]
MEDSWQNSSQSNGYTNLTTKASHMSGTHTSPSKSDTSGLRWHNSVAEDYNPMGDSKKNASVAGVSNAHLKKRKPSASTSIASSPAKSNIPSDGAFDPVQPLGNQVTSQGIPPTKKRRGRPPKNPPSQTYVSTIEFIQESGVGGEAESHHKSRNSPGLHALDTFVNFPESNLHGVNIESFNDADFQTNKYWDAPFAGSFLSDSHIPQNLTVIPGDIDLASATATFDWSHVPATMGATHGMMDPLRPLSMHSLGESFFPHHPHSDNVNFSFAQDPLSASDVISPGSVNPNLIFANQDMGKSYGDDVGFRPYHQQNLQQQEELVGQRKRQSKAALENAQLQASAGKPARKRALTESVFIQSTGRGKLSNVPVHPSPRKQMGAFPGKMRSAIRDENTTPSPTVDGMSRRVTPGSSGSRNGSGKTRTTVNFSISPGGRAKAEKVLIEDRSEHSDSEGDNHGEYDTDSSTDEDDLDPNSSYSMAARRLAGSRGHRRGSVSSPNRSAERPKLARFKTTQSGSFSSSSRFLMSGDFTSDSFGHESNPFLPPNLSMSSFRTSPQKRSPHKKGSRRHSRNSSLYSVRSSMGAPHATNLGSMREEDEYSEAETVIDEPTLASQGDAIVALKQAVARRNTYCAPGGVSRRPPSSYGTSRPSTRHTNMLPSSPPMQQQQHPYGFSTPQTVRSGYSSDAFNISPTTVTDPDCVTPTTYGGRSNCGRHDFAMDIRCSCVSTGSPEMPVLQW